MLNVVELKKFILYWSYSIPLNVAGHQSDRRKSFHKQYTSSKAIVKPQYERNTISSIVYRKPNNLNSTSNVTIAINLVRLECFHTFFVCIAFAKYMVMLCTILFCMWVKSEQEKKIDEIVSKCFISCSREREKSKRYAVWSNGKVMRFRLRNAFVAFFTTGKYLFCIFKYSERASEGGKKKFVQWSMK